MHELFSEKGSTELSIYVALHETRVNHQHAVNMSIHEPIYGLFRAHRVVVWSTQGSGRGRRCSTILSHAPLNFVGLRRRGWRTCFLCVICGPHLALELHHLDAQDPAEPTTNGGPVRKDEDVASVPVTLPTPSAPCLEQS
jgi:hypothetical protein